MGTATRLSTVGGNNLGGTSLLQPLKCSSFCNDARDSTSNRTRMCAGTRFLQSELSGGALRLSTASHTGTSSPSGSISERGCISFRTSSRCVSAAASSTSMRRSTQPEPVENLNFFERLSRAWDILFPAKPKVLTVRQIAKERLQVILASDRCEVPPETQRKIVNNIVEVLSDFLEIEAQEKVQLDVTADRELGTVYSVMVPVRRVRLDRSDLHWYNSIEEATFTHLEQNGQLLPTELHVDPTRFFDDPSSSNSQSSSPLPER